MSDNSGYTSDSDNSGYVSDSTASPSNLRFSKNYWEAEEDFTSSINNSDHLIEVFFKSATKSNRKRTVKDSVGREHKGYLTLDTKLGSADGFIEYCDGIVITDHLTAWEESITSSLSSCVLTRKGPLNRQLCFTKNESNYLVVTFYNTRNKFMVQGKHDNMIEFLQMFKAKWHNIEQNNDCSTTSNLLPSPDCRTYSTPPILDIEQNTEVLRTDRETLVTTPTLRNDPHEHGDDTATESELESESETDELEHSEYIAESSEAIEPHAQIPKNNENCFGIPNNVTPPCEGDDNTYVKTPDTETSSKIMTSKPDADVSTSNGTASRDGKCDCCHEDLGQQVSQLTFQVVNMQTAMNNLKELLLDALSKPVVKDNATNTHKTKGIDAAVQTIDFTITSDNSASTSTMESQPAASEDKPKNETSNNEKKHGEKVVTHTNKSVQADNVDTNACFIEGPQVTYNKSAYKAFYASIASKSELRSKEASFRNSEWAVHATHIFSAYSLDGHYIDEQEDEPSKVLQHLLMEQELDNALLIVTREYGGRHIGDNRWSSMREAAIAVLNLINLYDSNKKSFQTQHHRKTNLISKNANQLKAHINGKDILLICDSNLRKMDTSKLEPEVNGRISTTSASTIKEATKKVGIKKADRKYIIISVGTNDLHDTKPIDYTELINTTKTSYPNANILVCQVPPRQGYEEKVNDTNQTLRNICKRENIFYINSPTLTCSLLQADGKHLNKLGIKKLEVAIRGTLKSILSNPQRTKHHRDNKLHISQKIEPGTAQIVQPSNSVQPPAPQPKSQTTPPSKNPNPPIQFPNTAYPPPQHPFHIPYPNYGPMYAPWHQPSPYVQRPVWMDAYNSSNIVFPNYNRPVPINH